MRAIKFSVLSSDIMRVPPPEILRTTIRVTIVGGEIVHMGSDPVYGRLKPLSRVVTGV